MVAPLRHGISERRRPLVASLASFRWLDPHWIRGLLRAGQPVRLGLCLVGLLASWILASMVLGMLGQPALNLGLLVEDPVRELAQLGQRLVEMTPIGRLLLGSTLAVVLSALWSLIGAYIARAEVLQRLGPPPLPDIPGPAALVAARAQSLVTLGLLLVVFIGVLFVPALLARFVNQFLGLGVGAVLVALALPLLLLVSFVQVIALVGAVSWVIMPATVAVENTDTFDAIAHGYSYLYQRPFSFTALMALTLLLAALPLAAALTLADPVLNLPAGPPRSLVLVLATTWGLSILWTHLSLVYLKMRHLVDAQPEDKLTAEEIEEESRLGESDLVSAGRVGQRISDEPDGAEGTPRADQELHPLWQVAFRDTLFAGRGTSPSHLGLLLLGAVWAGLMLAGAILTFGALVLGRLDAADLTPTGLLTLFTRHSQEHGHTLLLLGFAAAVLGVPGLGRAVTVLARGTALSLLYGHLPSTAVQLAFARRSRRPGWFTLFLLTAGVQLALLVVLLLPLGLSPGADTPPPWELLAGLTGAALVLIALGGFASGSVVEEGLERPVGDPVRCFVGNLPETLLSALINLPLGLLRWLVVAVLAGLTWWLLCDTLTHGGEETSRWLRWGLGGVFWPQGKGLYWFASVLAGMWFVLLAGLVAVYPLAYLVRWGTACYLRARPQPDRGLVILLIPEERRAIENQPRAL